jgi:hypothetical protein
MTVIEPSHNIISNSYRWPIGLFFALIAIPFVAVWTMTQSPKVFDKISPTYTVLKVGAILDIDSGLIIKDATFRLNHICTAPGSIYLSGMYLDGGIRSEVLIHGDQNVDDNPLFKNAFYPGAIFTVPEMRFMVSKALLSKLETLKFMIPCRLPLFGNISAYTNSIVIN